MIFQDKTILVTGGTGSLGKILVWRLLSGELGTPKKIIVLSRDEAKQHQMRLSYARKAVSTDEIIYQNFQKTLQFRIGDVRDYRDICAALQGVDVVINSAALKQVPTCEYFPLQAINTNCSGAANIVQAILEHDYPVELVVGVSTDKAVKPINVMGMSKALQERIIISGNLQSRHTKFICVRYGNVLASRGSVVPLFIDQIRHGGPVTITEPNMTRFLLSINQAVDTIFAAVRAAKPGEIYVPIVPAATIMNVAKALIGDRNIEITVTGIRPGEKIHEILVSDEESYFTVKRGQYYVIESMLPEISQRKPLQTDLQQPYSSGDDLLDLAATKALLVKHQLLSMRDHRAEELLV